MRDRIVGVDAGGTMTKAALFDTAGHELACERRPNVMLFPKPGHTERDPEAMWRASADAIAALLEKTGTPASDVAAVCPSGYGSGLYVVDRDGQTVRPGIVSTDMRGENTIAAWQAKGLIQDNERRIQQRFWPEALAYDGPVVLEVLIDPRATPIHGFKRRLKQPGKVQPRPGTVYELREWTKSPDNVSG